jgi:hypothetical protein
LEPEARGAPELGLPISGRTFSANHWCLIYNTTSSSLSIKTPETSQNHTITQSKTIRRQQYDVSNTTSAGIN